MKSMVDDISQIQSGIKRWKKEHESTIKEVYYALHLIRKNPLTLIGTLVILGLILVALFAPFLAPYPENAINLANRLRPPSMTNLLGTDDIGRDILSRIIYGSRISILIAAIAVGIALGIGVPIGAVAGYSGGTIDDVVMRITDVFLAFPSIVLALAIGAALGRGIVAVIIAVSLTWWPWYTRLVRAQAISIRESQYVEAAKAVGARDLRIIYTHVLPNCIAPIIVQGSMDLGNAILAAAALGFLGIGAQEPIPEWGLMVSIGRMFIINQWWVATFPGLAIVITVLGFNLLGDGLRDILDPRLRR
jgi:peptide/nickel transport system permease protein